MNAAATKNEGRLAQVLVVPIISEKATRIAEKHNQVLFKVLAAEPCFATTLDWLLCDGIRRLAEPDGDGLYLRLSTRPVDQAPFTEAHARIGDELRSQVVAGGYRLVEPLNGEPDAPHVVLAACGAVVPEAVYAARQLADEGVAVTVLDLTSPDRLYRSWRGALRDAGRAARAVDLEAIPLAALIPPNDRRSPIVTVHDAASHSLAWLGSVFGQRVVPVGVDEFGQSGAIVELYETFDLLPEQIANAALVGLG